MIERTEPIPEVIPQPVDPEREKRPPLEIIEGAFDILKRDEEQYKKPEIRKPTLH